MSYTTKGFSTNRLSKQANNPIEVVFAKKWKKENSWDTYSPTVSYLIPDCTKRDSQVAATIVQWLGSPVGQGFLCDVISESPELQRSIMDRCSVKLTKKD